MQTLDGTVNAGSNVTWLPNLPIRGDLTVNAGSPRDLRSAKAWGCGS